MLKLLRRLSRYNIRFFRVFEKAVRRADALAPAGVEMRHLPAAETLALCADAELDLRPEKVSAAYARGDACIGAFRSGRMVGYCWIATAPTPHLDCSWATFPAGAAWIYKSLVLAHERGRGIAPALYRFAEGVAYERGCRTALICVEEHNTASVRAALRAGYAAAGRAAYIARPRTLFAWHSPVLNRVGVRFVPDPA